MSEPDQAGCLDVYYDGACPLCTREIALYRRLTPDGPVAFRDVSACAAMEEIIPGLDGASAMRRFHVRSADGQLYSGAAAFAELWRHYPGFRTLGRLLRWAPLLWIAEGAYRLFLVTVRPAMKWGLHRLGRTPVDG